MRTKSQCSFFPSFLTAFSSAGRVFSRCASRMSGPWATCKKVPRRAQIFWHCSAPTSFSSQNAPMRKVFSPSFSLNLANFSVCKKVLTPGKVFQNF